MKVIREEGKHHIYKASGTKAPTDAMLLKRFFDQYGLICEKDEEGRWHTPDRQVEMQKQTAKKGSAKTTMKGETEV